jgi:hypothetical protein
VRDEKGRFTSAGAADYGRRGGRVTAQRHGTAHMSRIGRAGFAATVKRHWAGDSAAFVDYLVREGRAATDPAPWNGRFQRRRPWGAVEWLPS